MSETVPKGGWKLGRDSHAVLVVWFKDGNIRTFFSIDWRHRLSKSRDNQIGLSRLRKLVAKYGTKADTVLISKTDSPLPSKRTLLEYYYEGVQHEITDELRMKIKGELSDQPEW